MKSNHSKTTVAVIGGTGKEGKGLAYRWAIAGYKVLIGSRTPAKAVSVAEEVKALSNEALPITGTDNLTAADSADIVVLSVPYKAHRPTLESIKDLLQGKLLIDVTVPLVPPNVGKVQMPLAGSAAQEAREILGENVEICSAFQNISHEHLMKNNAVMCDVLVTGTSEGARANTIELVEATGLRAWDAGPLENSVVAEGLTSVLIGINKRYGSSHAGIIITGVDKQ